MPKKKLPTVSRDEASRLSSEGPPSARVAAALAKLGLAMKTESQSLATAHGLSPTQAQILAVLVANEPQSGSELARRLSLTLPTISESVSALVAKGLAEKRPDPRHPRASLVVPTARGRAAGARARSGPDFLADVAGTLEEHELEVLYRALLKMIHALQLEGRIPLGGMCLHCTHFSPHVHEGPAPHHCALMDRPLADTELRLECREQSPAADPSALFARFAGAPPPR
jgi:DNA-binding MarR family transcriptional regulator